MKLLKSKKPMKLLVLFSLSLFVLCIHADGGDLKSGFEQELSNDIFVRKVTKASDPTYALGVFLICNCANKRNDEVINQEVLSSLILSLPYNNIEKCSTLYIIRELNKKSIQRIWDAFGVSKKEFGHIDASISPEHNSIWINRNEACLNKFYQSAKLDFLFVDREKYAKEVIFKVGVNAMSVILKKNINVIEILKDESLLLEIINKSLDDLIKQKENDDNNLKFHAPEIDRIYLKYKNISPQNFTDNILILDRYFKEISTNNRFLPGSLVVIYSHITSENKLKDLTLSRLQSNFFNLTQMVSGYEILAHASAAFSSDFLSQECSQSDKLIEKFKFAVSCVSIDDEGNLSPLSKQITDKELAEISSNSEIGKRFDFNSNYFINITNTAYSELAHQYQIALTTKNKYISPIQFMLEGRYDYKSLFDKARNHR